jgi:UDP-N-acetylglucosamine diphosphorylase/glucosamine-1-phosphate N-acetyltransferase
VNPEGVSIGNDCSIKPGVVFDAEDGPIIIGNDVTILSHTYLQGPLFIGDGCLVKAGTRIYGGTSIGPGCKLGGEISESIFQSWSNKQHDGFIGHAYIGEWVNLGADTNNSDLKNSYANVQVTVNGETVDTGSPFAGLYMGDHGKSGINTMFNTGTSIGPGANIVGYGYPSVNIPPLSWSINGKIRRYKIDKFYITAQKVKDRRGQEFTLEEKQLFKLLSVEG